MGFKRNHAWTIPNPMALAAIYKTITSNVLSMFTQDNLRLLHTVCTYVCTYRLPIVYIYSQAARCSWEWGVHSKLAKKTDPADF